MADKENAKSGLREFESRCIQCNDITLHAQFILNEDDVLVVRTACLDCGKMSIRKIVSKEYQDEVLRNFNRGGL